MCKMDASMFEEINEDTKKKIRKVINKSEADAMNAEVIGLTI